MFERFNADGRKVIVFSQLEARELGQDHIGPEHLLLGATRIDSGVSAQALTSCGVEEARAREVIRALVGAEGPSPEGHIPFSSAAKSVLASTLRTSKAMDDQHIGPEHIIIGVTYTRDVLTAQVLSAMDVDLPALRERLGLRGSADAFDEDADPAP